MSPTVHASCIALGETGVLIRGASGAGKSRLAHILIVRGRHGGTPCTLVADDRVHLENVAGVLEARPAEPLAGLLEIRGLGIVRLPHRERIAVGLVVDLLPVEEVPRLPLPGEDHAIIEGVTLPRLAAIGPESGADAISTLVEHLWRELE